MDDMQFGFMPGRRMTDALFIVRRMQEEYREKDKKLYIYFVKSNATGTEEERTTRC